jgi:hypothetical protein
MSGKFGASGCLSLAPWGGRVAMRVVHEPFSTVQDGGLRPCGSVGGMSPAVVVLKKGKGDKAKKKMEKLADLRAPCEDSISQ